jgi:hypothetical protein
MEMETELDELVAQEPEPKQIYFGRDKQLSPEEITEINKRPLLKVESDLLWQEQLNRELTEGEMHLIYKAGNAGMTNKERKNLADALDITVKRLKSILAA